MISRVQITALLFILAVAWAASLILFGIQVTPDWFRPFSTVTGVAVLVLLVCEKWLWRIGWLQPWLFQAPDLQGTWRVTIRPTNSESNSPMIEAYMVIRQTYSSISLRLLTQESHSETMSAKVVRCDDGTCTVAGVYRNTPRLSVRSESPLHHGAILLAIHGKRPTSLEGQYWTDRRTQGEISLKHRVSKLAHTFDEAKTLDNA